MNANAIILYEGEIQIATEHFMERVLGRVWSSLTPCPIVHFSITSDSLTDPFQSTDITLRFGDQDVGHRVLLTNIKHSVTSESFSWTARGVVIGTETTVADVEQITFELINFPARALPYSDSPIIAGGWRLDLTPTVSYDDFRRIVTEEALFVTTFEATLRRDDGAPFPVQQGLATLDVLRIALAFTAGGHVGLWNLRATLAAGRGSWRDLGPPRVAPWSWRHQWLSSVDRVGLAKILKLLLDRRSRDNDTWAVDRLLVEYYLEANGDSPLEIRVAAAQAGLEALCWDYLVESGNTTLGRSRADRKEAYRQRSAAGVMELMVEDASLSIEIPVGAQELGDYIRTSSGPVAVARVRNAVTHPRRREGDLSYPQEVWRAAWQLSIYYLELLILRRLGYSGGYVDRFISSPKADVQQVPWTTG